MPNGPQMEDCPRCEGKGTTGYISTHRCPECQGTRKRKRLKIQKNELSDTAALRDMLQTSGALNKQLLNSYGVPQELLGGNHCKSTKLVKLGNPDGIMDHERKGYLELTSIFWEKKKRYKYPAEKWMWMSPEENPPTPQCKDHCKSIKAIQPLLMDGTIRCPRCGHIKNQEEKPKEDIIDLGVPGVYSEPFKKMVDWEAEEWVHKFPSRSPTKGTCGDDDERNPMVLSCKFKSRMLSDGTRRCPRCGHIKGTSRAHQQDTVNVTLR